jgi:hypothetical protein
MRYKWSGGHGFLWGLYGFGPYDYGSGGFVTYLPLQAANASAIVAQLFKDRWRDEGALKSRAHADARTHAQPHTRAHARTHTPTHTALRLLPSLVALWCR